jgi:hypothetical protein
MFCNAMLFIVYLYIVYGGTICYLNVLYLTLLQYIKCSLKCFLMKQVTYFVYEQ